MKMATTMEGRVSLRYIPSHLINANPKLPKVRSKRKQTPKPTHPYIQK